MRLSVCPSSLAETLASGREGSTREMPLAIRSSLSIPFPAIRCLTSPGTQPFNYPYGEILAFFLSIGAIVKTKLTIFTKDNFHKKIVQVVAFVGDFNRDLGLKT
jgi:hypothetical protein